MPNIVITRNTTPQFTPYGAIDSQFSRINDTHMAEGSAAFPGYTVPRSIGPSDTERNAPLIRAEDLHQIPSNAENIQARLYFHTGGGFSSFDAEARSLNKYWLEFAASWNNYTLQLPWDTPGALSATDRGDVEDTVNINAGDTWFSLDIPLLTADIIRNPINNTGVGLFTNVVAPGFRFIISSFFGADGLRPEWHVSYTDPVPGGGGGSGGVVKSGAIFKSDNLIREIPENIIKGGGGGTGPNPVPTVDERAIMVFGHSLFNHGLFMANEFTNTAWTMGDMSRQSFNYINITMIFGQLRDQPIPPIQGQSFGFVTNQYENWLSGDWDAQGWDDVLVMSSNFEQISKTPVEFATESDPVLDYVATNSPASRLIIYEHWAEPTQYGLTVIGQNEMSPTEWETYKELHRQGGAYHNWQVAYQDAIAANGYTIFMIPVGPIIFDAIQTEPYLASIQFQDLFVDEAPHGNANMYHLTGLITSIALFGLPNIAYSPRQESFLLPELVTNQAALIAFIQSRLAFYAANGVNVPT